MSIKLDTPAIAGGAPVRETMLPEAAAMINESDVNVVADVLRRGELGCGAMVRRFERAVADYVGAEYAVAVSSGAASLHIALMAAAVGPQEEVITTPLTHPATSNCILYQGGVQIFVDIDQASFNLDPQLAANRVNNRTRAIIPVHYAGNPCDMGALQQLARDHELVIIEDAAHALGGEYDGKKIGALSDLTVFSFSSPQHCYLGEGGMVTTNSRDYYDWLMIFRENGIVSEKSKLVKPEGPWKVEMQDRGYNYRMTEMQAALGLAQLERSEEYIIRRTQIAERYNGFLADHPAVTLPRQNKRGRSTWHSYVLAFQSGQLRASRRELYDALRAENIGVGVPYLPVYLQPYYLWIGHPDVCTIDVLCPRAEELYGRLLTLPIYPAMEDRDVEDVLAAMGKVLAYYQA